MSEPSPQSTARPVAESLREYARGIAGGMLFSLPLLYTMEVWWAGLTLSPGRIVLGMVCAYGLLLGYNRYAGLRSDASFAEVAIDSVEELGIGLVIATVALWLLGQLDGGRTTGEMLGKIVTEALTVAIGVSVGTAQLGSDDGDGGLANEPEGDEFAARRFRGKAIIALCGAVLFAANVAPTEEIIQIAFETSFWRLLLLALASLILSAIILNFSDFRGANPLTNGDTWRSKVSDIIITYAIALFAAAALLWFFGRFQGLGLGTALGAIIVLGTAASLGASAGRLLLQAGSGERMKDEE